jgi:hypothetical protein
MFNAVCTTSTLYHIGNQLKYQLIKTFNGRTQIQSFSVRILTTDIYIYRLVLAKKYLYLETQTHYSLNCTRLTVLIVKLRHAFASRS